MLESSKVGARFEGSMSIYIPDYYSLLIFCKIGYLLAGTVAVIKLDTFRLCGLDLTDGTNFWPLSSKLNPSTMFSVFFLLVLKNDLLSFFSFSSSIPGLSDGKRVDVYFRSLFGSFTVSSSVLIGELQGLVS